MDAYFDAVRERLRKGAEEYGDRSFDRPLTDLTREIREELADIGGWAAVMWTKLDRLENMAREAEENA